MTQIIPYLKFNGFCEEAMTFLQGMSGCRVGITES